MKIRPVCQADFTYLAKLYTYYALNTTYTYYAKAATPRYMSSLLTGEGHYCAVAEADDGCVWGYVHISPSFSLQSNRCEIAIYLIPDATGKGVGKLLARHGMRMAAQRGYTSMGASVCTENERSLGLFNSLGFRKTDIKYNSARKFGRDLHTQHFEYDLTQLPAEDYNISS